MDMRDEVSQSLRDIGLISRNETYVDNVYAHGEERRKVIMVIEDSKSKQRRRLLALKERVGGKDAVRLTKEGEEGGGILLRLDVSDSIHGTAYLLPEKSERERLLRFAGYSIERALSLDSNSSTTAKFDGHLHMELAGFHPEKKVEHLERAARGFRDSLRLSHENGEIDERDGMALFREHLSVRGVVDIYEQLFVATGDKKYLEEAVSFYDSRWITPSIRHYCFQARGDLLMRLSGLAATPEERGGTLRRASQAYGDAVDSVRKHGDFMGGSAEVFAGAYALRKGAVEVSYDGKAAESSFREGLKALGYKGGYTLDGLIDRLEKTQYKHDSKAEKDKRYNQMKTSALPVLREIRKSEEASKVFGRLLQSPAE